MTEIQTWNEIAGCGSILYRRMDAVVQGIIDDGMEAEKHHVFIVSVRLIRSFEYRNIKTVVIKDVHPLQTVREFQTRVEKGARNLQCESELQ